MNNLNSKKADILIVDDVPENLQILFTMLTEQDYEVRRVLNGKQALKAAQAEVPDLILLDIKMPDLDGYQVCEKLKASEKTKNVPVIFLSALNDTLDKVKAFSVGGVDYITKPFQLQEVIIRVENQLKLLTMQRQLEQKNKDLLFINQELEAFSYRISHDLRNLLLQIKGASYLLDKKYNYQLNGVGNKLIKLINNAGDKMEDMIKDLLRLSEVKHIEMLIESVDLTMMIEQIIQQIEIQQPNQKINFIIAPNLKVKADEGLLKIALNNLLENACKYTSKQEHPCIEVGELSKNNSPVYFIKDNGIGFDEQQADKIFVPFQRLHNSKDFAGTGIGLATVQRIIERHGGKIWYESQINQGTTFYFTLETQNSLNRGKIF